MKVRGTFWSFLHAGRTYMVSYSVKLMLVIKQVLVPYVDDSACA